MVGSRDGQTAALEAAAKNCFARADSIALLRFVGQAQEAEASRILEALSR